MKDLKEVRDKLLQEKLEENKDPKYKQGYADGVLDMYNQLRKEDEGR